MRHNGINFKLKRCLKLNQNYDNFKTITNRDLNAFIFGKGLSLETAWLDGQTGWQKHLGCHKIDGHLLSWNENVVQRLSNWVNSQVSYQDWQFRLQSSSKVGIFKKDVEPLETGLKTDTLALLANVGSSKLYIKILAQ